MGFVVRKKRSTPDKIVGRGFFRPTEVTSFLVAQQETDNVTNL